MIALGLVTSRLDYFYSLLWLCGTSKSNISKLQRVQNDLARIVPQAGIPGIVLQAGIPAQNCCSNRCTGFQTSVNSEERIIHSRSFSSHSTCELLNSHTQSAGQLHTFTELEVRETAFSSNSIPEISCRQT